MCSLVAWLWRLCGVLSIAAECLHDQRLDGLEELGKCLAYWRREVKLEVVPATAHLRFKLSHLRTA